MTPADYIAAAVVPESVPEQEFGLWTIKRHRHGGVGLALLGTAVQTVLYRISAATLHLPPGEIVMDDSKVELARHLPLWMHAHGRILVSGLGLGCVVRGLLANRLVDHVDVIEIDPEIVARIGGEFLGNARVTIHTADALQWEMPAYAQWDFAWHDIHADDGRLQHLHARLMIRYRDHATYQGAWMFPRWAKRCFLRHISLLGVQRKFQRPA